jgi:hypothetical protein
MLNYLSNAPLGLYLNEQEAIIGIVLADDGMVGWEARPYHEVDESDPSLMWNRMQYRVGKNRKEL